MPRDDAFAVVTITGRGLRKQEKMTDLDQKFVRSLIQETIEEVGLVAQEIIAESAPVRTGRLREGVQITGRNRSAFRPSVRVGVDVRSEEGFPYLNVTRFGRRAVVANKRRVNFRPEAGIGSTRRPRTFAPKPGQPGFQNRPRRSHMLRFEPGPPGSGFMYRQRVRAYHPGRDWVRTADEDIQGMADYGFKRLTDEIEKVLQGESAPRKVTIRFKTSTGSFR